jgi:hypothetical protein
LDINKLETVTNFAKRKSLSRQHVYRLVDNNELTMVKIDGIAFIFLDSKANAFVRKRKINKT